MSVDNIPQCDHAKGSSTTILSCHAIWFAVILHNRGAGIFIVPALIHRLLCSVFKLIYAVNVHNLRPPREDISQFSKGGEW